MVKEFEGYDDFKNMILNKIEIRGIVGTVTSAILNNVPFKMSFENQVLQ